MILSEEEFAGWQETVHLLSSPKNAVRLLASIRQLDAGQGRLREPVDDEGSDAAYRCGFALFQRGLGRSSALDRDRPGCPA